jgi:hypothetical protein
MGRHSTMSVPADPPEQLQVRREQAEAAATKLVQEKA